MTFDIPFFVRLIVAAIIFTILFLAIPVFLNILNIPVTGDILKLIRWCLAAIAVLFVVYGRS